MKHILQTTIGALLISLSTAHGAETTVTVTGVHNCCRSCENGITKAVGSVRNASASVSGGTVTITVKNKSDSKKAVAALLSAGYFGKTDASEQPATSTTSGSSAPKMVKSASVSAIHLCCQKCADAAIKAVTAVPGVTGHTVKSKATTFDVTGEFDPKALAAALNGAGFNGKIK